MPLRDYQLRAKKDIYEAFEESDIVFLVLFTGGGKTVIFTDIIKDQLFLNRRAMLMAHREELIFQACRKMHQNKIFAGVIKSGERENFTLPCQVCSVQTIIRRKFLPEVHLVVIDEGHHATETNSYGQIIKKILANNPEAKILLVSATPYRLSGEGFEYLYPGKKTKLIVNSTLKSGIENGWAVPLDYYVAAMPDLSGVHIERGDYVEEEARKAMSMVPLVKSYKDYAEGTQCIVFAINVKHSLDIVKQYRDAGYNIEHLDATTPDEDKIIEGRRAKGRKTILSEFRAGIITHICNVGILTEGSDFPTLVTVQLAAPGKSLSLHFQKIGRATRPEEALAYLLGEMTKEQRLAAIATSSKPLGIILDNCSAFIDHGLPDEEQNWERHFIGGKAFKKEKKEDEEMEMLVFIAEDETGARRKFYNAKEVEGLKLIKVTKEIRKKLVNLKALKEFDRLYAQFQRMPKIKKPGYVAFEQYKIFCKRENLLMVPEVWEYLERKLVLEHKQRIEELTKNFERFPDTYPLDMLEKSKKSINAKTVSENFLRVQRQQYARDNSTQLASYLTKPTDKELFSLANI